MAGYISRKAAQKPNAPSPVAIFGSLDNPLCLMSISNSRRDESRSGIGPEKGKGKSHGGRNKGTVGTAPSFSAVGSGGRGDTWWHYHQRCCGGYIFWPACHRDLVDHKDFRSGEPTVHRGTHRGAVHGYNREMPDESASYLAEFADVCSIKRDNAAFVGSD